jgi:hypothetical protein
LVTSLDTDAVEICAPFGAEPARPFVDQNKLADGAQEAPIGARRGRADIAFWSARYARDAQKRVTD